MPAVFAGYEAIVALSILSLLFAAFVWEKYPPEVTAAVGAAAFFLLGFLDQKEVLSVFSNSAPITIAAMFVISGALVRTGDLLNDRGMMGDGVIDLPAFRAMIEAAGFHGAQEVEIFSDHWWSRPGDEVLATCVERFRTVC